MDLKDRSLLREQCFVGGDWIGTPATTVTDPPAGAVIAKVPRFGAKETREAIAIAAAARQGSHYADEEFVEVKYMLMGGHDR